MITNQETKKLTNTLQPESQQSDTQTLRFLLLKEQKNTNSGLAVSLNRVRAAFTKNIRLYENNYVITMPPLTLMVWPVM